MCLQVNALDTLGQTALHRAALAGHLQTCRQLLGYGADASLVSLQGFTAAQMGNEAVQQILNGTSTSVCVCLSVGGRVQRCRVSVAMYWLATVGLTGFVLRSILMFSDWDWRCGSVNTLQRRSESTHLFRGSAAPSSSIHTHTVCFHSVFP